MADTFFDIFYIFWIHPPPIEPPSNTLAVFHLQEVLHVEDY